jgi:phosphoglycolate phosphatase
LLLIFDWDGTLSDSANKIIQCLQQAADDTGYPIRDDESIRNIIGLGLPEAMKSLYPELSAKDHELIKEDYIKHFLAADQTPSPFFDGVLEGLNKLRDKRFTLAVATGKSRRGMKRVLKNLDMENFFHGSRCADETASKPDPLMLNELLSEFKFESEKAIMIGDTEYDMAMAQKIDMPRVAVSYGAHHIDRLDNYQPILKVNQFTEFVDWIVDKHC